MVEIAIDSEGKYRKEGAANLFQRSSGGPKGRKRSPIPIWESEGNPCIDFLVVIMASSIARGRVRTTTTTTVESRKMAAILQIIGSLGLPCTFLIYITLCYNWHLSNQVIR